MYIGNEGKVLNYNRFNGDIAAGMNDGLMILDNELEVKYYQRFTKRYVCT